jgi:hypothetical protein
MDFNKITSITVRLVEDPNDSDQLLLDLGTELCEQLGWNAGDTLEWWDNKDGTWTLTKPKTQSRSA